MEDPYDLQRFVEAQNPVFEQVCRQLREGRKSSHWMWFVFPQLKGLGRSETARKFAISCKEEAQAYLAHPILGARLRECCRLANLVQGRSAHQIFGSPDDVKFHSSLTLFAAAAPHDAIFRQALQKYFAGEPDPLTLEGMA